MSGLARRPSPCTGRPASPGFRQTAAPVLDEIIQCALERDGRRPSELVANAPGVPDDDWLVARTVAVRIDSNGNRDTRAGEQHLQQVADENGSARTDVVDAARLAAFDDRAVGAY